MAKYKVKHTNIMHGERLYKEGSIIELSNDAAARLSDFVELIPETKTSTVNKPSTKTTTSKSTKTSTNAKTVTKTESLSVDGGVDNGK